MVEELERAIGEALPYRLGSPLSLGERRSAQPAA